MAAATDNTRHVSFAPATPIKEEPGFPMLERRFSEIGQYISDASNVLIAAPRPRPGRPELGAAQDSIILAKKKLGGKSKTPPRDRGLHLVDVHMSPGRDLTAEDFDEIGDSEDEWYVDGYKVRDARFLDDEFADAWQMEERWAFLTKI